MLKSQNGDITKSISLEGKEIEERVVFIHRLGREGKKEETYFKSMAQKKIGGGTIESIACDFESPTKMLASRREKSIITTPIQGSTSLFNITGVNLHP